MTIPKGLRHAYDAQDACAQAIADLNAAPRPLPTDKALLLSKLVDSLDRIQERIRILRGKPLPGTASRKRPAAKDTRPEERSRPAISPVKPVAKPETISDKADDAGALVEHAYRLCSEYAKMV